MPQPVCLFPTPPQSQSRLSTPAIPAEGGSSKFGGLLNSACSTDASASKHVNASPEKRKAEDSNKKSDADSPAESSDKSRKASRSKSGTASKDKISKLKKGDADEAEELQSAEEAPDAMATTIATANAGPEETGKIPAERKSKAGDPPEQPSQPTVALLPQTPVVGATPPSGDARNGEDASSQPASGEPSKGPAAVEPIQTPKMAGDEADTRQDASQSATATGNTPPPANGKPGPSLGAAKLGEKLSHAAKGSIFDDGSQAQGSTPASAPAPTDAALSGAANIAAATADEETSAGEGVSTPSANPQPHVSGQSFAETLLSARSQPSSAPTHAASPAPAPAAPLPPPPREAQFAEANHTQIVSGMQAQLLPNGGTMQLHLHPAELGVMSVSVHMRDGVMTATFETSNDQASKLLTHSLGQLKTALESQGVSIGRLHVQQAPRDSQANSGNSGKNSESGPQEKSAQQQEQQRREMLRKMWRRLNGGQDPLDMVA